MPSQAVQDGCCGVIQKPERHRCPAHLRWVATIPCIACTNGNITPDRFRTGDVVAQAHHLGIAQPKGRGIKAGDQHVVPMCPRHHDPNHPGSLHHAGNERFWWSSRGIDPLPIAEALWAASVAAGRVRNIERKAA